MGAKRGVALVTAALIAICVPAGGSVAMTSTTWWPASRVVPGPESFALAANSSGGFLLAGSAGVLDNGYEAARLAYCAPSASTFAFGHVPSPGPGGVFSLSAVPGGTMFAPDGRSTVLTMGGPMHPNGIFASVGSAATPATFESSQGVLGTGGTSGPEELVTATSRTGAIAVAGRGPQDPEAGISTRRSGSTPWITKAVERGAPKGLAVDGSGGTTLIQAGFNGETFESEDVVYYAPPEGDFAPVSTPGSFYTAVASDSQGRTAIVGYTPKGPAGAGLYLSRRESPDEPFGPPVLLSRDSQESEPQLVYDEAGNLTVVWVEAGHLDVALAPPKLPPGSPEQLSAPAGTTASDERLSIDAAGEAVLAWAAGPHERPPDGFAYTDDLHGNPTPIYAAIRATPAGRFGSPQLLTTAAQYAKGPDMYNPRLETPRVLDAIGGGRAMVAWAEQGPLGGPAVETALYALDPGCAAPAPKPRAPIPPPRVRWFRKPIRHHRVLTLGALRCPVQCTVTERLLIVRAHRRVVVARNSLPLASGDDRTVSVVFTRRGLALVKARTRTWATAEVVIQPQEGARLGLRRRMLLRTR